MMKLSDSWEGTGSQAALDEASALIDRHEANASAADAPRAGFGIWKPRSSRPRMRRNRTAEDVQRDCEKLNKHES